MESSIEREKPELQRTEQRWAGNQFNYLYHSLWEIHFHYNRFRRLLPGQNLIRSTQNTHPVTAMKKLFLTALTATALIAFGCKKTGGVDFASIVGRWRYSNSTTDTLTNGQWGPPQTGYDSSIVATLAD